MARWKAGVDFLLTVIELLFLSLTLEAPQGKTCQNSLPFGVGGSVWAKISGEGVVPAEYFFGFYKLDTFCYLTVQTAPCYVQSFWHNIAMWQTDGQTDRIGIASTVLAMQALWRAVIKLTYRWLKSASDSNVSAKYKFPVTVGFLYHGCRNQQLIHWKQSI